MTHVCVRTPECTTVTPPNSEADSGAMWSRLHTFRERTHSVTFKLGKCLWLKFKLLIANHPRLWGNQTRVINNHPTEIPCVLPRCYGNVPNRRCRVLCSPLESNLPLVTIGVVTQRRRCVVWLEHVRRISWTGCTMQQTLNRYERRSASTASTVVVHGKLGRRHGIPCVFGPCKTVVVARQLELRKSETHAVADRITCLAAGSQSFVVGGIGEKGLGKQMTALNTKTTSRLRRHSRPCQTHCWTLSNASRVVVSNTERGDPKSREQIDRPWGNNFIWKCHATQRTSTGYRFTNTLIRSMRNCSFQAILYARPSGP